MPPPTSNTEDAVPSCENEGTMNRLAIPEEMEHPSEDDDGEPRARSDTPARLVTTQFLLRPAAATLATVPDGWPPNDSNDMGLIGLLWKGTQHRSSFTVTPRPAAASGPSYHEPGRGAQNERQSHADLAHQEAFEGRPATLRRRRRDSENDREIETDSRENRSVRRRALRVLLEVVLGDVSGDTLGDDMANRGNPR
jgi:hypothetical protein